MFRSKLTNSLLRVQSSRSATFSKTISSLHIARLPRSRTSLPVHRLAHHTQSSSRFFSSTSCRQSRYVKFNGQPQNHWDISELKSRYGIVLLVAGGAGVYYLFHLEQVPETGRWRFMDVNPKYETKLAAAARDELLREFQGKVLPPNHPITRHVRRVLTRLLDSSDLGTLRDAAVTRKLQPQGGDVWNPDTETGRTEDVAPGVGGRQWELIVVNDDKVVNAAATYGNVVVFTGILPIAKDEQGLAAVLGHEIGHVVARHNSERYSSVKVLIFLAYLLEAVGLDIGLARMATTFLLDLPNSRTLEYEADQLGLGICARACYDPRASPEMFSRLGKLEGGLRWDFLNTHPTSDKRIQQLDAMLPEAYAIRAASPACAGTADAFGAFSEAFASGFGGFSASRW